ncbi:MAG: hypothetical protein HOO96_17760 [Polyangiaceae bacterium]|nr:hypothetical protein [Polyangiaceae bacterium]
MAVVLEFANVVVRKAQLEAHVAGGVDLVLASQPPNFSEDEHLVRVGFMSTAEAVALVDYLVRAGLPQTAVPETVAIVQLADQPYPTWLEVGPVDEHAAAWLAGSTPGKVALFRSAAVLVLPAGASSEVHPVLEASGATVREAHVSAGADAELLVERGEARLAARILLRPDGSALVLLDRPLARAAHAAASAALLEDACAALVASGATLLG